MKTVVCIFLMGFLAGCYQMHSDDDLRTTPVTNNPLLIPDSAKTTSPISAGM